MVDIQVKDLTKFFVIGENLLEGLSFEIQEGERVAILGRNGCGKTTLLRILTGEMDYDSGEVYVNPNKRIGLISQIPQFPLGYTVEDVLRSAYADVMAAKRKMEQLEKDLESLAAEKAELEESLNSGTLPYDQLQAASERIACIIDETDEKELRLLELYDCL
jgi:ATPase subunit of ABC transporter with duplicated ATPase domains